MVRTILISGSPRKGNTERMLGYLHRKLDDSELLLLRQKDIQHCNGCMVCKKTRECPIVDDMLPILKSMESADVIVLGIPNYFDSATGLAKDFIDRTHPCYTTRTLEGKKLIVLAVGGGSAENTQKWSEYSVAGLVKYQGLQLIGVFAYKALEAGELQEKDIRNAYDSTSRFLS
jgi:multimeric flavodoxin WrbA